MIEKVAIAEESSVNRAMQNPRRIGTGYAVGMICMGNIVDTEEVTVRGVPNEFWHGIMGR